MEQCRSRSRLTGREERFFNLFLRQRIALVVFEELQSRGEQPVAHRCSSPLARFVHPGLLNLGDRFPESRRQRLVAIVTEAGLRLRCRKQRMTVQDIGVRTHEFPATRRINSSSASRTFWAERAAYLTPAMPP